MASELIDFLSQNGNAIKAIVELVTATVALLALLKGLAEYIGQNALKRFEKYQDMNHKFCENAKIQRICDLLDSDRARLREMPFAEKKDFLGFYEDLALMCNSGLMNFKVAYYMFGYYIIRSRASDDFLQDVNIDGFYWSLFDCFAKKMKSFEERAGGKSVDVSSLKF
jgi:hypothetical protein